MENRNSKFGGPIFFFIGATLIAGCYFCDQWYYQEVGKTFFAEGFRFSFKCTFTNWLLSFVSLKSLGFISLLMLVIGAAKISIDFVWRPSESVIKNVFWLRDSPPSNHFVLCAILLLCGLLSGIWITKNVGQAFSVLPILFFSIAFCLVLARPSVYLELQDNNVMGK